jgi:hypothetical protein
MKAVLKLMQPGRPSWPENRNFLLSDNTFSGKAQLKLINVRVRGRRVPRRAHDRENIRYSRVFHDSL